MEMRFYLNHLYSTVRITYIHYARVKAGWSYPDHKHTSLELQYCASGVLPLRIDGEMYELRAGETVMIKSGCYHRTETMPDDCEFFVFHFDIESKQIQAAFQLLDSPLLRSGIGQETDSLVANWIERFLAEYAEALEREYESQERQTARKIEISQRAGKIEPSSRPNEGQVIEDAKRELFLLRIHSRLLEFISMLGERIVQHPSQMQVQPSQANLAHEAAHLIETGYAGEIQIGELSQRLSVHRSYLCDCFKKVYGMSPKAYINQLRTRQAKFLLLDTTYTVEEIAGRLNFSSSAHFCRFFRQMTGTSPARFRHR